MFMVYHAFQKQLKVGKLMRFLSICCYWIVVMAKWVGYKILAGDFGYHCVTRVVLYEHYNTLLQQVPTALNTGTNAWDGRQQAAARPRSSQPAVRFSTQSSKPASKDTQRKPVSGRSNDKSSAKTAVASNFEGDNDSLSSQTELVRPTLSGKQKTELACYKCDKRFGVDHHSELIDHLDTCTGPA